jgi:hypothetical protein
MATEAPLTEKVISVQSPTTTFYPHAVEMRYLSRSVSKFLAISETDSDLSITVSFLEHVADKN